MTAISLATPAAGPATTAPGTAQTTLGNNYQTFLKLLMTQLRNQDPTSPLDTNQFTSQLVQYSSVEQQIATNSNLGQLIQLGQSNAMLQSASLVGHKVTASATQVSLQSGQAQLQFTADAAGPFAITIADAQGKVVDTSTVQATKGANSWSWNGTNARGTTSPDGAYTVLIKDAASTGSGASIPFTVTATATAVTQDSTGTALQLGGLSVPFSAVRSVQQ